MSFIKDFFLGKFKTETFELERAVATIKTLEGAEYSVTRTGYVDLHFGDMWVMTGSKLVRSYLSDSRRKIINTDSGTLIPVGNIKSIAISVHSHEQTRSWR